MPNSFDFSQVGKNMPYRLPEGTFEQMQAQVMARIEATNSTTTTAGENSVETTGTPKATAAKRKFLPLFAKSLVAAAAVIALCFVVRSFFFSSATDADVLAQEIQAYDRLTTEDQDFLLEVYEDDMFLDFYTDSNQQ